MLIYRLLTAIVLIPCVILFILFANKNYFLVITGIVAALMAFEWTSIIALRSQISRLFYVLSFILLMIILAEFSLSVFVPILYLGLLWWVIAFCLLLNYPKYFSIWHRYLLIRCLLGYLLVIPCWVGLNVIRVSANGQIKVLLLMFLIWGSDSAAYFIGRRFGRHKLAKRVSPGKTLEGLYGAILAGGIIAAIVGGFINIKIMQWPYYIFICIFTILVAILGDLTESMIKRQQNIKDSGHILPGHGGLFDRLDSLTSAAPIFALLMLLFGFI